MSQMLKSSGALGAATLTSRVLGLVREIAYASFMADGWVAASFKFAFIIPNLFRRLLGEGALTAAFIPIFKEKEKTAGEKEMWRAANAVISGLVIVSSIVIAAVLVARSSSSAPKEINSFVTGPTSLFRSANTRSSMAMSRQSVPAFGCPRRAR